VTKERPTSPTSSTPPMCVPSSEILVSCVVLFGAVFDDEKYVYFHLKKGRNVTSLRSSSTVACTCVYTAL